MEEYLRPHESLMADVDFELLLCDVIEAGVVFDPLDDVRFVFSELFGDVRADVAETLFDRLKIGSCSFCEIKEDSLSRLRRTAPAGLQIRGL